MNTTFKTIAATLGVFVIISSASAEPQSGTGHNRALHKAIAMQGDQALLDIRSGVAAAIDQSIQSQMSTALRPTGDAELSSQTLPLGCRVELAALATER